MKIKRLRHKIDVIDAKIISCLNERAKASLVIGQEKLKQKKQIYAPDREQAVLRRIRALNRGPMKTEALEAIYREIMSSSLALEKPLQIAYLGPEGSFTHLAAVKKFGSQLNYTTGESLLEVFQKVEQGECDYGVVPIENSTEGAVTHTLDLLVDSDLKICSQVLLKISHHLLSQTTMDNVKRVYSNPNVFGQCRNWLLQHLPKAEQIKVASTTLAAQIARKEKGAAAIGSKQAAALYHLNIIANNIQDVAQNVTRFFVIATEDVPPTGKDRTSILFSIKDKVGALHDMLEPFSKNKLNLTKIESRPSKKKAWDYYFFVDIIGHREEPRVKKALGQLEDMCKYLKVLGSYPVRE
jgi:chorismate mutase / prephenate dehydratase